MRQTRRMTCIIGWHRWQVAAEEHMRVRICSDCGRRRYHGPLSGSKNTPETTWGLNYTGGGGLGGDGS